MNKNARIFLAGHGGLVGSAINRRLLALGYKNILTRTRQELDLSDQKAVNEFFESEMPEFVILAAAKVGGIAANNEHPVEFLVENLQIQNNVIGAAYEYNASRLMFLGSSCIYPKESPQPIREEFLLTGQLEATNRPYAIAKIAGVEYCWSLNREFGTKYFAVMPSNLYGPGDNYQGHNSHVIPALIKRFHEAKIAKANYVELWGTGRPRREFLYSADFAEAAIGLLNLEESVLESIIDFKSDQNPPLINIGFGSDITILELAGEISKIVGFQGEIRLNPTMPDGTFQKLMDITKITKSGWKPTTSLQVGLSQAYSDFVMNQTK